MEFITLLALDIDAQSGARAPQRASLRRDDSQHLPSEEAIPTATANEHSQKNFAATL